MQPKRKNLVTATAVAPAGFTLTAESLAPETAQCRLEGGQPNTTYFCVGEGRRPNGELLTYGEGDLVTDGTGSGLFSDWGGSDSSGARYTATFTVDGVSASCEVEQYPASQDG